MTTIKKFNSKIRVYYADKVNANITKKVINSVSEIVDLYSELFGEIYFECLNIYLSPRQNTDSGEGYCRPVLIVLPCGDNVSTSMKYTVSESLYMFKYLAHELGHLWWNLAAVDNKENWLNESFAEYACLLAIREIISEDEYNRILLEYDNETKGLDSISNCDVNHEDHFKIWYMKGPYILSNLETQMGRSCFLGLLQGIIFNQVNTTKGVSMLMKKRNRDYFNKLIR